MSLESEWYDETSRLDAHVAWWRKAPPGLFADYLESFAHELHRDLARKDVPIEQITNELLDLHRMLVIVSERLGLDAVGFEQLLHTRRLARGDVLSAADAEISLIPDRRPFTVIHEG